MPPQTPAQKASTSLPLCSNSSGLILSRGMRRTQTSCSVGLRLGLNLLKKADWKIGSEVSMGSNTSLRVAPQNTPTVATVPAAETFNRRLKRPRLLYRETERRGRGQSAGQLGELPELSESWRRKLTPASTSHSTEYTKPTLQLGRVQVLRYLRYLRYLN